MKIETTSLVIDNFYIQWLKIFHIYQKTWRKNINLGNWTYGSIKKIHIVNFLNLYKILRKSRAWLCRHSIFLTRIDNSFYRAAGPALITLKTTFELRGSYASGYLMRSSAYRRFNIFFRRII